MCSICAMADFKNNQNIDPGILSVMGKSMKHRGPDDTGLYLTPHVSFCHNRLSVMDVKRGKQPMTAVYEGKKYIICYNGEIYNTTELKKDLVECGAEFFTDCDTEVLLWSYIIWGRECVKKLNGIFAFIVYDESKRELFLARDRFGVKPLFYSFIGTTLVVSSEIKAMLSHPSIKPKVDKTGLWQLLFLSPVTFNNTTVFRDIFQLSPGECATFSIAGFKKEKYWTMEAKPHTDSREETIYKTKELLKMAVKRQLKSDVPLCTFLSGGLDSSAITAIASKEMRERGGKLSTYSFEYEGNKENFRQSLFQPKSDDDFATGLSDFLFTDHKVLTVSTENLSEYLSYAVDARDFPGQADIDSSLIYFCEKVKENHTVALSGECSDEIFGGYPWFYREEMLKRDFFPWIHDPYVRVSLFKEDVISPKDGYNYVSERYRNDLGEFSFLDTDTPEMKNSRIATNLSVKYFMTSLLERKDRMSMARGVEVRVPFADHHLAEYVYNVPWDIKFENATEKSLLRYAVEDYLPKEITWRKKSPYPKSHDPSYAKIVTELLRKRLSVRNTLFCELCDKEKITEMLSSDGDTWFGQLMAKPQLIAWLLQFDYWLEKYNIVLV